MGKSSDLIGKQFGKLTVLKVFRKNKMTYCDCMCLCSGFKTVRRDHLLNGVIISCGCFRKEKMMNNKINLKHGCVGTRFYNIYNGIKLRCNSSNRIEYERYGGRGIKVCDNWLKSFENFRDDMYESYLKHVEEYGEKDTTIERIDNDGDYSPENCRWATINEQALNRRDDPKQKYFRAISPDGKEYISNNQREFALQHGLNITCVSMCLNEKRKKTKGYMFEYVNDRQHTLTRFITARKKELDNTIERIKTNGYEK